MARYDHLPIFKAAYDLLIDVMQVTKTFPRDYRYTLGEHFHNTALEILKLVYKTNSSKDKTQTLRELAQTVMEMGILIRISHDLKIMADNRFVSLTEKRDCIEKQTIGWLKSSGNSAGISSSE